ncbi:radical SAM protein [Nocardia otitidiscaviarum]|uniref:radical SAM protein n=1 Tax=Nocardia otitidiscaviarum TaxID=1823 RepID=UPI002456ED09|nr:radical SAM protein [Nocardia otitidiscaviarum]
MITAPATHQALRFLCNDPTAARLFADVLEQAPADAAIRAAMTAHLAAPHTPAAHLATLLGLDLETVCSAYHTIRTNTRTPTLTRSLYYPHRIRWAFATATLNEWNRRPEIPHRILTRQPVLAETMEIHPTRGTCNYRCRMCLWSDQTELTYTTQGLDTGGLMTAAEWTRVLGELWDAGVRRLVVSGGGEALINPDLPSILNSAAAIGFEIHVYTTGFAIRVGTPLFDALLRCHRIRLSIHSPDPVTYDQIAGTRPRQRALERVSHNLTALHDARADFPSVGIGMVIQSDNHDQIAAMAKFAESLDADWLDLRKDEVDVTENLTLTQLDAVREQLRTVRSAPPGNTRIDIGDELVAIANNVTPDRSRTSECVGRWFRPTIGAYGHLTPCDLKAEPRFAASGYDLGNVKTSRILDVVEVTSKRQIADDCTQCMPSSRTGNAIVHKLLDDLQAGIGLDEQPF